MKLTKVRLILANAALIGCAAPAAFAQQPPSISASDVLANPGETAVLTVNASGVQIYECKAAADGKLAWAFKEPRADLTISGKTVGKHYAGPSWEHGDGSLIKGKVRARADAVEANSIPWLKLDGIDGKGAGTFAGVTTILRTETKGGTLSGACPAAGKLQEQPYTSDYVFLKKS